MPQELTGRVALVTGAGRNIGRGIALSLAEGGAAVVVNVRADLAQAESVAREIERAGGRALAVTADVADARAVRGMVDVAVDAFRPHRHPGQQCRGPRRAGLRRDVARGVARGDRRDPRRRLQLREELPAPSAGERRRSDRQYRRALRPYRRGAPSARGDRQGRARRFHARARARACARRHPGKHGDARPDVRPRVRPASPSPDTTRSCKRSPAAAASPPTSPPPCASCAARARASSPGRTSRSTAGRSWGERLRYPASAASSRTAIGGLE